jgi:hypothetical protein
MSTMSQSICPYCNAALPALAAPPTAEKLPCPRCGEPVPAARWQVDASVRTGAPPALATPPSQVPGKGKTVVVLVSIMVAMAIIGLSYALWTTKLRRSRDPKGALDPITNRKPLELKGLEYLPKDADVVIGLHLAEWMADKKVGRPLLEEPRPAPLEWIVGQLPRITGMPLDQIDHVVLAGSFEHLQIVMIVKTRRPYALEKIAEIGTPLEPPLYHDRALYEVSFNPPARALLWCVEAKTLVCVIRFGAVESTHLAGLSETPRPIDEVLPARLQAVINERLAAGERRFFWGVGRLERADALKELPIFPLLAKGNLGALKNVKAFAVSLEPDDGLTLAGNFELRDAKAAANFKTLLDRVKIEGAKSQKAVLPPESEKEQWVSWQVRSDVDKLREWLAPGKK